MTELAIHETSEQHADRAFEDGIQLSCIAGALGQSVGWDKFTANVTSKLSALAFGGQAECIPSDDARTDELYTAAKIGDKHALASLAAKAYVLRRVEDGSRLHANVAADQISKFAKALSRSNVTRTHAGATSLLVKGIEDLQQSEAGPHSPVYNYTNGILHALRTKQTEARLSLGAKSALAIGAVAGFATLKQVIKR